MSAIARRNPVAKLAAALSAAAPLVLTIDWVSALTALALECALLPFAGVPWRTLWRRTAPVWLAAPLLGLTIVLYGTPSGRVHWSWFTITVSDGSIALGVATALRVLAIGLPGVVLFLTVDPTDLADGLAQLVRLPARFVLGALAAVRLVTLLGEDWRALALARRSRGLGDRGRIARWAGQAFALLVLAVRRGGKVATAMEARGFGAPVRRTWARESVFTAADWALVAGGLGIAVVAATVAVVTGHWNFVFHA